MKVREFRVKHTHTILGRFPYVRLSLGSSFRCLSSSPTCFPPICSLDRFDTLGQHRDDSSDTFCSCSTYKYNLTQVLVFVLEISMEICHRSDTDTTKNGEPSLEWGDEVWMTRKRRCTHAATAKPQTRHTATTIQLCNYQSKLSNGVKVNVKKGKVQTYTYILYAEFCLVHLYELLTATSSNFPSRHHYWSPLPSATIFHMRVTTHENHVAHQHGDFDPHVNLAMTIRRAWTPKCSGVIHFTLEDPCRTSPLIQFQDLVRSTRDHQR